MFKKNPNRPPISISLKKTPQGYKVLPNETYNLFNTRKIIRSMYRPDLIGSVQGLEGQVNSGSLATSTMIQPPSHVTIPAVANWFDISQVNSIQIQAFPEFFTQSQESQVFSFTIKNKNLYMYYRNLIISMWRQNAKKYLSPSLCRKNILGDVSIIMRLHSFLQNWGLINFPSKQHNKGHIIRQPDNLQCYICQIQYAQNYYIADIQDTIFQICQKCYNQQLYPLCIKNQQFRRVKLENHLQKQDKIMNKSQINRMLQILNGVSNGTSKDKDKDTWSIIQKQFTDFTKEQIIKSFLKIPLSVEMNAIIFQNGEDIQAYGSIQQKKQIQKLTEPSIFQDYANPIMGSIASSYYHWKLWKNKKNQQSQEAKMNNQVSKEEYSQKQNTFNSTSHKNAYSQQSMHILNKIFELSQSHARILAKDQSRKVQQLTKMLIQVILSKLQLKSLFISQYQKLIEQQKQESIRVIKSKMAECLKFNCRQIQGRYNSEVPKQLNGENSQLDGEFYQNLNGLE